MSEEPNACTGGPWHFWRTLVGTYECQACGKSPEHAGHLKGSVPTPLSLAEAQADWHDVENPFVSQIPFGHGRVVTAALTYKHGPEKQMAYGLEFRLTPTGKILPTRTEVPEEVYDESRPLARLMFDTQESFEVFADLVERLRVDWRKQTQQAQENELFLADPNASKETEG